MPSKCVFMFDHPNALYYSGDMLKGKIILTTDKVKNVRAIYITIKGVAKVRWRQSKKNYHGKQIYLDAKTLVEGEMDLPAGTHEYTFQAPLPKPIPSSISGKFGHVSYEVELKLDRPLRPDNEYTNSFTVMFSVDLNEESSCMQPIVDEDKKFFGCCCCKTGPIRSELRTDFAGYVPGQIINFTILFDNEASEDIEGCVLELVQTIAFQCHSPEKKTKTEENVICFHNLEGANRYSKKLHKGSIGIPPVPPTNMSPHNIINISYALRAKIESQLWFSKELLRTPITIGTVPLATSVTHPNSVITIQPTAPMINSTDLNGVEPPEYGSIVSPLLEEARGS